MEHIEVLLEAYDLVPTEVEKLDGYASLNYRLLCDGKKFVLKHYTDPDEYNLIEAEDFLLQEISKSSIPFSVSHAVRPLHKMEDDSFTRLVGFIEGDLLSEVDQTDELLTDFGYSIAALHKELAEKRSQAIEARRLFWDMQYTLLNVGKTLYITAPEDRKVVDFFFDLFEQNVLPVQEDLRRSIIHSDLNDNNVLVKGDKVSGLIDFGDITYAPLIYEIAIAITYIMLANEEQNFHKAAQFIAAYHKKHALRKEEIELLYYLIPARLCVSVCNSAMALSQEKDTAYILVSQKPAWRLLHHWLKLNPLWVNNFFLGKLGFDSAYPASDTITTKRTQYIGKSIGTTYETPIYMTGGCFQYMFDNLGNTYLDAYNNIPHVGHCHPVISKAISKQVRKLNTNTRYLYAELADYAEKLCEQFPQKLNKVFFVNSGSAASDLAVRLSRTHTKKRSIAILENGYHGNTTIGIEISDYKYNGKGGSGKSDLITSLPLPNLYHGQFGSAEEYANQAIDLLTDAISKGLSPATLIIEPVSGCGGQVPLAEGYLKMIEPFLQANRILLTSDEVQTGFGRLGKHFWGFEMHDVVPDIVVLGKPMGNGHPLAAVVATEEISNSFSNGMEFFSSFGGNPVSCAVGMEVLSIMEDEKLQDNARLVGDHLLKGLNLLKNKFKCVGDVRGLGLFLGVEFVNDSGVPDQKVAAYVKNKLKDSYILVGTDGPNDNVIKIKPPLCFSMENADQLLGVFEEVLDTL